MAVAKRFSIFFVAISMILANSESLAHNHRDTLGTGTRINFVQNMGQWDNNIRFATQMQQAALFVEPQRFTIVVRGAAPTDAPFHHARGHKLHAYRINFVGCNDNATIAGNDVGASYENFFIGNDPQRWKSHVPNYSNVEYADLYPNINLRVYSAEHALKYDFIVFPGADPNDIALFYEGDVKLKTVHDDLIVSTSVGEILEAKPYVYQEIDGIRHEILSGYRILHDTVRFELGDYDTTQPLIIDPTLYFSTYTGSTADNWGTTAAYDSYKNTYTAGLVFSIGFPASLGAYDDSYNGNADIGIFKFDETGTTRIYATYLGGNQADMPHSMYVNSFDELLLFGTTGSDNFPTTENAYQRTFKGGPELAYLCFFNSEYYRDIYYPNGSDIFVSRLSADGSQLQASTFVGGTNNDGLNYRPRYNESPVSIMQGNDSLYYNYGDGARGELITDDLNNIYVGSTTFSINFPVTANALQQYQGGRQDGVVFKLDYNMQHLLWSTYLGGNGDDAVYAIDTDNEYNLLVCGGTNSTDMHTTSDAFQRSYGGGSADGFIAKIAYNGDQMMAYTYFGSDAYDQCYFVRSGKHNDVFVFGQTCAAGNTMIFNANYSTPNSGMLLARFSPNLDNRIWSTVFGTPDGHPNLSPSAFTADICDRVYAAGWGRDFVGYNNVQWNTAGTWNMATTPTAYQSATDGQDFYLMCLNDDASALNYATFFGELHINSSDGGTDHVDGGTSRFDRLATLYQSVCASCGSHSGFPTTPGVWSNTNPSNNCNNALFRFNVNDDFPVAEFVIPPIGCSPYTISFHNTGRGDSYLWDFGDGTTSTEANPTHTFTNPGNYEVQLIALMPDGCRSADTQTTTVKVLNPQPQSREIAICTPPPFQMDIQPMTGCSYHWTGGTVSDNTIANPIIYTDGTYILTITTANNACTETDTFHVQFNKIIDTLTVTNPTCPNGNDGSISVAITPYVQQPITYYWNGVESSSNTLTGLSAGTYRLRVEDNAGCFESERTITLTNPPTPEVEKETQNNICNDCEGHIHLQTSNGQGMPYSYTWNDGPIGDTRNNLCQGTYIATISDTNGCIISDTTTITLQNTFANVSVWADDTLLFTGESTTLHATSLANVNYEWSPNIGLQNPHSSTTVATPEESTTYTVLMTDSVGCTYSDTVAIHCIDVVCGRPNIFIPNSFTPNSDGVNDYLCFRGEYITAFHIVIVTRWGEVVYESHDIQECWDGRYKDNWCQPGVYMYVCNIECEVGQKVQFKGDITIIR